MADLSGKMLLNRYRVDVYKVWGSQYATYLTVKILLAKGGSR